MKTSIIYSLILCTFFVAACKKESKTKTENLEAKIVCGDCTYILQNGSKPLVTNKTQARYNETINIQAKKGDTILFFGYNYSLNENMDGYLYKDKVELKHGITHCGGNPSFFMQYIIP